MYLTYKYKFFHQLQVLFSHGYGHYITNSMDASSKRAGIQIYYNNTVNLLLVRIIRTYMRR